LDLPGRYNGRQSKKALEQGLSLGVLAGGIYGATQKWGGTGAAALTATGLAGAAANGFPTLLGGTPIASTITGVIAAGQSYIPLVRAKAVRWSEFTHAPDVETSHVIATLSGLWDAAGTGCALGILKGHSWMNPAYKN